MRISLLFCLLLQLVLVPAALAAEDAGPLSEIVVSASAEATPQRELPTSVQVITRDAIEKTGAESLDEVLERTLPGAITKYPGNSYTIGIRGFSSGKSSGSDLGDQVLLLIDGHRAGSGNAAIIPVGNIERIEIVRGPSSVLYGGSAMGGAVNVITKRGNGDMHGRAGVEYGTYDRQKLRGNIAGGCDDDRWGYSLAAQYESAMDYQDGHNARYDNTDFENVTAGGSLTYRPNDRHSISVVGSRFAAYDNGSPGGNSYITPDNRVSNTHDYLALEYDGTLDGDISVKSSLYGAKHWYEMQDYVWGPEHSIYETTTSGARLQVGVPFFSLGRVATGVEYTHIAEDHTAHNGPVYAPDSSTDAVGVFAEHKFDIENFTFLYGARFDSYNESLEETEDMDVTTGEETFEDISWRGGVTWYALDWLSLRSSVGTAYTPPTADKLAGEYIMSGYAYHGNPDLEAEKSLTYEFGADHSDSGVNVGVTYFHTDFDDRISSKKIAKNTYRFVNVDGQEIAGFEGYLNTHTDVDVLGKALGIAPYATWEYYTTRRNRDSAIENTTPKHIPEYGAVLGLTLSYDIVELDVNGRFTGEQQIDTDEEMDSFAIGNAKLTVHPTDELSVYFAVENFMDKYYAYTQGYPMPGRTFSIGMDYRF
jgi:vitamin B12 transporter